MWFKLELALLSETETCYRKVINNIGFETSTTLWFNFLADVWHSLSNVQCVFMFVKRALLVTSSGLKWPVCCFDLLHRATCLSSLLSSTSDNIACFWWNLSRASQGKWINDEPETGIHIPTICRVLHDPSAFAIIRSHEVRQASVDRVPNQISPPKCWFCKQYYTTTSI